jgi:hypothetical protein
LLRQTSAQGAFRGSQHRDNAKALAKREDTAKAITPFEAASATMQQRGERHLGRMANIVEKTIPHVEAMEPGAILDRVDDVEKLDKVARRTFGISDDDDVHGNNVYGEHRDFGLIACSD